MHSLYSGEDLDLSNLSHFIYIPPEEKRLRLDTVSILVQSQPGAIRALSSQWVLKLIYDIMASQLPERFHFSILNISINIEDIPLMKILIDTHHLFILNILRYQK